MPKDDRPFVITYISPSGSRGVFNKSDLAGTMEKILDLTFVPSKVRIMRTGERSYLVAAVQDPHTF